MSIFKRKRCRAILSVATVFCILVAAAPGVRAEHPTVEGYYQLQQQVAEQEIRLRQLESIRIPSDYEQSDLFNVAANSAMELRLAELEELVHEDGKGDGEGRPAESGTTQKWSGRVHFDYWAFPDASPLANFLETSDPATSPPDFTGFRRVRLGLSGKITDTMEYKVEMDSAAPSSLAFKDTYIGWNELPLLQTVLLGNQKRPYGLDHLNSSRLNVFMERPFHVEAYNQDARRIGLQSYGVTTDERWNWRYGYFLMDDLSTLGGQRTDNYQSEIAGRMANTIGYDESSGGRGYAHWAISASAAFPGGGPDARFLTRPEARTSGKWLDTGAIAGGKRYQLLGVETLVNVGAFQIVGELQTSNVQRTAGPDLEFGGGYVYVAYFLTGEHTPWQRTSGTIGRVKPFENFFLVERCCGGHGSGWGAWQIAARYSHADFTDDDIFGGVGDSFTLGLNWWFNPNARMQFNYIYGSIDERAAVGGAPLAAGLGTTGDYDVFGTRFMVDF